VLVQLSHTRPVVSATFDEPNLVSAAGLVPLMALACRSGLRELTDERLSVPTDKGANAGLKLSSLVAGMAADADSIEDMVLLRHGGMATVFAAAYAPSTLGSFLRSFAFGHVRQADAVASRFLLNLAEHTELLGGGQDAGTVTVDIDDTIVEVHGYSKQGAAFGYSGVRGLNALLATVSTAQVAAASWPAGMCWCARTRRRQDAPCGVPAAVSRSHTHPSEGDGRVPTFRSGLFGVVVAA
jgi:hypothetical protein